MVATVPGTHTMPAETHETEQEERARLIKEIMTHDHIVYNTDSPFNNNAHQKTLEEASLEHLREIVSHFAAPTGNTEQKEPAAN